MNRLCNGGQNNLNNFVFFNNRMVLDDESYFSKSGINLPKMALNLGDFCLTPIRYFYNGNNLRVSYETNGLPLGEFEFASRHKKEYIDSSDHESYGLRKNMFRTAAAIIFFVPGILLGTLFKSLAYCSEYIRKLHKITVKHYTVIDQLEIVAKSNYMGSIDEAIEQAATSMRGKELAYELSRPIKTVMLRVRSNENAPEIKSDPGLTGSFTIIEKLIIIGARIAEIDNTQKFNKYIQKMDDVPSLAAKLNEEGGWRMKEGTDHHNTTIYKTISWLYQKEVSSVNDALNDQLPEGVKQVYFVPAGRYD